MTQQEIEAFLAVVRMGSVSGAAQAMYITQPAVSRHIRALERELGCPLLVRGRGQRQVELTDQGRDFVDVAEKWRLVWREAREVASRDRAKTLNVASVGSVSTFLLPPVFRDFLEEKSGRALTFHNYHSQEAYDYVAEGLATLPSSPTTSTTPRWRPSPPFGSPWCWSPDRTALCPPASTHLSWTRPGSCACPGTRNTTCGTPSGSPVEPSPVRFWTRCPCWRTFSPGGEQTAGRWPPAPWLWASSDGSGRSCARWRMVPPMRSSTTCWAVGGRQS